MIQGNRGRKSSFLDRCDIFHESSIKRWQRINEKWHKLNEKFYNLFLLKCKPINSNFSGCWCLSSQQWPQWLPQHSWLSFAPLSTSLEIEGGSSETPSRTSTSPQPWSFWASCSFIRSHSISSCPQTCSFRTCRVALTWWPCALCSSFSTLKQKSTCSENAPD